MNCIHWPQNAKYRSWQELWKPHPVVRNTLQLTNWGRWVHHPTLNKAIYPSNSEQCNVSGIIQKTIASSGMGGLKEDDEHCDYVYSKLTLLVSPFVSCLAGGRWGLGRRWWPQLGGWERLVRNCEPQEQSHTEERKEKQTVKRRALQLHPVNLEGHLTHDL